MVDPIQAASEATQASLGAQLVQQLMEHAPAAAAAVEDLLGPTSAHRDALREHLLRHGAILPIPAVTDDPPGIVVVDGAVVTQSLYACDLVAAVAVSTRGLHPSDGAYHTDTAACVIPRSMERDRLGRTVMFSLELGVLAQSEAPIRCVDGSLATPVIAMLTALAGVTPATEELFLQSTEGRACEGVAALSDPHFVTIGLPKADTSSDFAAAWSTEMGVGLPPLDRILAAQVLEPGEYLAPRTVMSWAGLDCVTPAGASRAVVDFATDLADALGPLRSAAAGGQVKASYIKPRTCVDTVVKIEYIDQHGEDTLAGLAMAIDADTPGPYVQEPFAQHLADVSAKAVSVGIDALKARIFANLDHSASYMPYLLKEYRTGAPKR